MYKDTEYVSALSDALDTSDFASNVPMVKTKGTGPANLVKLHLETKKTNPQFGGLFTVAVGNRHNPFDVIRSGVTGTNDQVLIETH